MSVSLLFSARDGEDSDQMASIFGFSGAYWSEYPSVTPTEREKIALSCSLVSGVVGWIVDEVVGMTGDFEKSKNEAQEKIRRRVAAIAEKGRRRVATHQRLGGGRSGFEGTGAVLSERRTAAEINAANRSVKTGPARS